MIDLVMMALGSFRFGMRWVDYQRATHHAAYRWEQLNRAWRKPAAQYAGPGVQTITLEGVIYPHFRGGLHQLTGMRAIAGTGVPLFMTDGMGWVWDRWVIVSVTETKSHLMADGAPRKIEFSVELQSYGSDSILGSGILGLI